MKEMSSKLIKIFSILALAGMALAACGGAAQPTAAPTAPAPTEAPAVPGATEAPAATAVTAVTLPAGFVDTSAYKKAPPYTVCFSNASVSNSWRVMMNAHVDWGIEEAKAAGLIKTYRYADANDDPAKQISDVEDLLTQGCDVLILSAAASDVVDPAAQAAMKAGVPVVTLDRDVADPTHRVSYVEGDNCLMGTNQAKWLVKQLGGTGKIVELSGAAGASPAEERMRCANLVFAKNPGIEILAQAYTGWSPTEGQKIMANWITLYPKIDGIWSDAGLQGSGAVEAYLAAGLPVPPITGEDFQRFLHQWVDNKLNIYTYSFSTRLGYVGVQTALAILQGKLVESHVRVPGLEITSDNLMSIYNPKLPDDAIVDAMPQVLEKMYPEAFK
jgi:ribose transport system substrate-binding protein